MYAELLAPCASNASTSVTWNIRGSRKGAHKKKKKKKKKRDEEASEKEGLG